ncbi:Atxe2 family lasso peptide isopeptidase [Sphingomonas sp. RB3P16]|uniref:Atxe2 family lasso peptide isopeptidase n=1 Tax=Parasphingomonas frigoris TaxID=3096163 RepID=UPI002FC7E07D
MRFSLLWLTAAVLLPSLAPTQANASCHSLDWRSTPLPAAKRKLIAEDLVRLRDIGPVGDDSPSAHVMAISPDGKWLAFQLRQGDPEDNRYCLAMVVQPLEAGGVARFIDTGGEFLLAPDGASTSPQTAIGTAAAVTPRWAPTGQWFGFLKRVRGANQVWRADMGSGRSSAITPADLDVADFRIVDSGRIVVRISALPTASNDESRIGYHYDGRFVPMRSSVPILPRSETRYAAYDVVTRAEHVADAAEIALFVAPPNRESTPARPRCALSRSARGSGVLAATQIDMTCDATAPVSCRAALCESSFGPLWMAGKAVRYLRREGWARLSTAIYEWVPGTDLPRRLYATDAMLADCQPRTADELICLRETSLRPRHLVELNVAHAGLREILDPNPEFARLTLGAVERIHLTSSLGIPAFANIVLPTEYQRGRRYPLVVVQYQSRGFLRGGTGDEFPIQLFANHGFAVLSVQRPAPAGSMGPATDAIDLDRRNLIAFSDRRNVLSVIEQGVDSLVARGIVDPRAVGITGLSDGSSTVQFAALNSTRFVAGIASGCCWEPEQAAWLGPAFTKRLIAIGWPGITADAPSFWQRMSLVRNARDVRFPLLFEAADDEFRIAVESATALREAGKPVDLFVFPGEYHIKWQPAHKLAAYERGLDWFTFWLRGQLPDDPRRRSEAQRWAAMRKAGH